MKNRELREKVISLLLTSSNHLSYANELKCILLGAIGTIDYDILIKEPFNSSKLSWYKWNEVYKKLNYRWGNVMWEYEVAEAILGIVPMQREFTKDYKASLKLRVAKLYKESRM